MMSSAAPQRGDSYDDSPFVYMLGVFILIAIGYFGTNYALTIPAYRLTHFVHGLVDKYPYFKLLVSDSVNAGLEREYKFARYMIPKSRAIDQLNVCLAYFYPLIAYFFFRRLAKVARKTKASTYRYAVTTLDQIVQFKKEDFPFVQASYLFGEEMVANPDLQEFGRFSQEYGPVRWSILNEILYLDGKKVVFQGKEPDDGSDYFPVKDDIGSLSPLAGKLSVNINKLSGLFYSQLNRPFDDVSELKHYEVALCVMFLTYAKGNSFKEKAKGLRDRNANLVKLKKIETKKETVEFVNKTEKLDRKELESLINFHKSKLLSFPKHTNIFILSCYALAKINGADITPPEFTWLRAFNRELYLLLHTYSGDPKVIKNNGYIECTAALTAWLNMYEIFTIDKAMNVSDDQGYYPPVSPWQKLILNQCCNENIIVDSTVTFQCGLKKKEQEYLHSLFEAKATLDEKEHVDSIDLRNAINSSKRIIRLPENMKLSKEHKTALINYNYNSFSDQCMAILIMKYEQALSNTQKTFNPDTVVSSFIDSFGWMVEIDVKFVLGVATILYLTSASKLTFKDLISISLSSPEASDIGDIISEQLPTKFINVKTRKLITMSSHELVDAPDHYLSFSYGWMLIVQYKASVKMSKYSTHELSQLASNIPIAVEKSIRSYLYQMTTIEKWLRDEYMVSTEQLLESDPTRFLNSEV